MLEAHFIPMILKSCRKLDDRWRLIKDLLVLRALPILGSDCSEYFHLVISFLKFVLVDTTFGKVSIL